MGKLKENIKSLDIRILVNDTPENSDIDLMKAVADKLDIVINDTQPVEMVIALSGWKGKKKQLYRSFDI